MSLKVLITTAEEPPACHKLTVWHGEEPVRDEWDTEGACFLDELSWIKDAILEAYDFAGEDAV